MQLEHTFTVDAPIDRVWDAFLDPSRVAPCFPGARLTAHTSDAFEGDVKVKLGPISMLYKGKGTYEAQDESTHRLVIAAGGRDTRGNGTASATVTANLRAAGVKSTEVSVLTDMAITGRPAQFGRGAISDVADSIIKQFATSLASSLMSPASAPPPGERQAAVDLLGTSGGLVRKVLVGAAGALVLVLTGAVAMRRLRR
jgi:carbon monoxide dehydrogenase subunit G